MGKVIANAAMSLDGFVAAGTSRPWTTRRSFTGTG
jgi:hypothetical protein